MRHSVFNEHGLVVIPVAVRCDRPGPHVIGKAWCLTGFNSDIFIGRSS